MKKKVQSLLSITIAFIIAATVFCVQSAAVDYTTKSVTMSSRTTKVFKLNKSAKRTYLYAVKNNKGNIRVRFTDLGKKAELQIDSVRRTAKKTPSVIIYYKQNGENIKVKRYKVKVTPLEKLELEDISVNPKTKKQLTVTNPYSTFLRFKPDNKKIVRFRARAEVDGNKATYTFKGYKKGSSKVKVYLGDTGVLVGRFTINVRNIKSSINPDYKTVTLRYNKHGSSVYMLNSHIFLTRAISDVKYKATYSAEIVNLKVADKIREKSDFVRGEKAKTDFIYSTGKGTTTAEVYEKQPGKKNKRLLGKIKIKVKSAKMNYVARQNMRIYDNNIVKNSGLDTTLEVGQKIKVRNLITTTLINNDWTSSSFKPSQYKIAYRSLDPSNITVDKKGTVTAKAPSDDEVTIRFRIYLSDGTSFARNIPFRVISA